MNSHEQFAEDVLLYALGSLDEGERQSFEAHLQQCAECRRELQAVQEDLGLLALSTAGPKPPARSRERLYRLRLRKNPGGRVASGERRQGMDVDPMVCDAGVRAVISAALFRESADQERPGVDPRQQPEPGSELQQAREMLDLLKSARRHAGNLTAPNREAKAAG